MKEVNRAATSVIIIIIFSLGSKLLGFIREILIAAKFGSGMETDTFFVAATAIGLISSLIGTSINTTMIPILSEIEDKEGKSGKIKHTINILNILFIVLFIIVFIGWIMSPLIIKVLAGGFEGKQFDLAVFLMCIGLPGILFTSTVYLFKGYLQSELMFIESAISDFPYNFVHIFFLLFLSSIYGIKGLMAASVVAAASQIVVQISGVRKTGFRYKFICDTKDKYVKKILNLIPPVLIGTAINDLNSVIDKALASNLVSGSISALNYSGRLNNLVLGVFISSLTTVLFPMLSKESNSDSYVEMKKVMGHGINIILLITIPATVGLIILSTPIVQIAFERGAFDKTATIMTSQALIFYSVGLTSMALNALLIRVFYSLQDTKSPMINGMFAVGLNVLLNIILVRFMVHSGLALATSIAATIAILMLFYKLRKKIGPLGTIEYIKCGLKAGVASLIMGVAAYMIYTGMYGVLGHSTAGNLISLLTAVSVAALLYFVLCYMFGIEEVNLVVDNGKRKLKAIYDSKKK